MFAGRYRLTGPLGDGDGGRHLFRARDDVLARDVAVAVFPVDPTRRRRLSGARTLAALDHPALITLYDAQVIGDGNAYVIMEFITGPSLARRIETEGPVAAGVVAGVVQDLAGALATIHRVGIVHGRVDSSTVLLRPRRDVDRALAPVLTGFDITHLGGAHPASPDPGPLSSYLTPEQVRGEPARAASDVYALGLLALDALTGEPPLRGGPMQELVLAPLAYDPEIPARVGHGWRTLLTAMTDSDPASRPTAAEVESLAGELRENGGVSRDAPDAAASVSEPVPALRAVDLLRATSRRRPAIWQWVTHYR
uniref:protein kinase domain-containing protein n=1 Tax=Microbacterium sp. SORGH_AS_1204 TaxID=3041785 RepID=UPI0027D889FF|nr:protein kinase [Microbacterium sp. SORGH_AS_1204]